MIIPINKNVRVRSEPLQWVVETATGEAWSVRWYCENGPYAVRLLQRWKLATLEELEHFRRLVEFIEKAVDLVRDETRPLEVPPHVFEAEGRYIELDERTRVYADKRQFTVCVYDEDRIDTKIGPWRAKQFHMSLADAIGTWMVRQIRGSDVAGENAFGVAQPIISRTLTMITRYRGQMEDNELSPGLRNPFKFDDLEKSGG